jgi:hypothetical protein
MSLFRRDLKLARRATERQHRETDDHRHNVATFPDVYASPRSFAALPKRIARRASSGISAYSIRAF